MSKFDPIGTLSIQDNKKREYSHGINIARRYKTMSFYHLLSEENRAHWFSLYIMD